MTVQLIFLGVVALVLICFRAIIIEWLIRASMAIFLAAALGFFGVRLAGIEGVEGGLLWLVIAITSLLPFLRMVSRYRGSIAARKRSSARGRKAFIPPKSQNAVPTRVLRGDSQGAKGEMHDDWEKAADILGGADLSVAQANCNALLGLADASPVLDPAVIERAVFLRRQLPGLVSDAERALAVVSKQAECSSIRRALEKDLLEMGKMARAILDAEQSKKCGEWEHRHLHVSSRLSEFNIAEREIW